MITHWIDERCWFIRRIINQAVEAGMKAVFAVCALGALSALQATGLIAAPEWVSCRGNDVCNSRDEVIAGIGATIAGCSSGR
jgi:hypothetical protein